MTAIVVYESPWGNTPAKTILGKLASHGYRPAAKPQRFIVTGKYGPLPDGELAKAKAWGAELATASR